jgi:uncharacterized protein (DUF1501 family)
MKTKRRSFLTNCTCTGMTSLPALNMLLHLRMAGEAAAQGGPTNRRTIVCVMLAGGWDTFNLLVPRDARHAVYATSRGNLALPLSGAGALLPLNQAGGDGLQYGIHSSCSGLAEMFNGLNGDNTKRRAAFLANIGTLIHPTTKAQYLAETVSLPRALFSHSDQIDQWQTSVPQGLTQASGWAGRVADLLHSTANTGATAMNISFSGNNLLQVGNSTQQFVVTQDGALTLTPAQQGVSPVNPLTIKNTAHSSLIAQTYANLMQQSYATLTKNSLELQQHFKTQFDAFDASAIGSLFPDNAYGEQMLALTKTIAIREQLGVTRQTLFVNFGGWDHHGELLNTQAGMLNRLSPALIGFQKALDQLNLQDSVITFTASDFARTLRSNGRGTDHAWGGNSLVFGGPVQGGSVLGTFPDLALESNDDVGYGGRLIPTLSVDQLFAELLRWFGVSATDMPYVLPNITNFYNPGSSSLPIGFLKPGTWS